ncbi:MAG: hypothetical protein GY727_05935, partial [Gammaproteobacteria bacterium]|nr:hypothetical protein [Gammaproteobacteria bacterium]
YSNTTGRYNTALGYNADVGSNNLINATAIGANAEVGQSNSLVLGSINGVNGASSNVKVGIGTSTPAHTLDVVDEIGGTGFLTFVAKIENTNNDSLVRSDGLLVKAGHGKFNPATRCSMIEFQTPAGLYIGRVRQSSANSVNYLTTSDKRLKENINPTHFGLKDLLKIEVSDYNYIADQPSHVQTGFIAQQLYTAYPPAVGVGGDDVKTNPWEVDYGSLTPLLVQAVQEQQTIIDAQQAEIETMKAQNEALQTKVDEVDVLKAENEK